MEEYYFYTEGLTVGYHGVPLIKNIKISLKKGEILTLIGPNGAGKTTIFDAIVFALYGEASSSLNKKEGVVLQSQYVDFDSEPYVELVFSEGRDEKREIS